MRVVQGFRQSNRRFAPQHWMGGKAIQTAKLQISM
jgi:hypothetical protein